MNNEQLENKIAELLNASEDKSEYVFSLFKEMLSDYLEVGEALTIEKLGTFQLKEQLSHSAETKLLDPSEKALTLIFAPETTEAGHDYLFMNIELNEQRKDYTEFDENIFKLGIGKPLATDSGSESEDESSTKNDDLKERIAKLFDNSTKSRDFDLWEDHLKTKEQKSILESDEIPRNNDLRKENLQVTEEKFLPLDDEDVFKDITEDNETISEASSENLIEEFDLEDDSADEIFDLEVDEELAEDSKHIEDTFNSDEKSKSDNKIIEKIENSIDSEIMEEKEDLFKETGSPIKEIEIAPEQENVEATMPEEEILFEEKSIEQDEYGEDKEKAILSEDDTAQDKIENYTNEKSNKFVIYILITAFVIVAGISSYYIFRRDSLNSTDSQNIAVESKNKNKVEQVKKDVSSKEENVKSEDINQGQESVPIKQSEEITTSPLRDQDQQKTEEPEESEVSKNIFFDGTNYSVQISSWKQRTIAEREVQKLIKSGYPTFIQQIYIPKFDGVWNRVRIGPFATLEEAKEVQGNLNK